MDKIIITREEFLSYEPLKQDKVHLHNGMIYKYDTESKSVIDELASHRTDPKFESRILLPLDYLYLEDKKIEEPMYFGYTAEYYRNLKVLINEIKRRKINPNIYFKDLMEFIEYLNSFYLLYWDFHAGNILVQNGHPFIIDIDDISLDYDCSNLACQREYLTEFMLNSILYKNKSVVWYKNRKPIKDTLSKESLDYLDYTFECSEEHILPYGILEELNDKDKVTYLKRHLKN